MTLRIIKSNIYSVGVLDWDRTLFDEIIPLPEGTSYNSYLIKGSQKTALIDTADPSKKEEFLNNIKGQNIDYIISHHAEQDHSGLIPDVVDLYPEAKVLTNPKCKELLMELLLPPLTEEQQLLTLMNLV